MHRISTVPSEYLCFPKTCCRLKKDSACNTDTTQTQPHQISNTQRTDNKTTDVVIQQQSRKLLMMDTLMSETCWAHKKWNKVAGDIKLVFYSSGIFLFSTNWRSVLEPSQCAIQWVWERSGWSVTHRLLCGTHIRNASSSTCIPVQMCKTNILKALWSNVVSNHCTDAQPPVIKCH